MFKRRGSYWVVALLVIVVAACGSDGGTGLTTGQVPEIADSDVLPPADDEAYPPEVAGACVPGEPECEDTLVDDSEATEGQDRSAELVGRWEVVNYLLPDGGGLTNVVGGDPVYIEFGADGTVRYHTGCNAGGTEYTTSGTYAIPESALDDTLEGQAITIGPLFEQTSEGCTGFLGDQDRDLPADMGLATRVTLDDDRLFLLDAFLLIEATRSS